MRPLALSLTALSGMLAIMVDSAALAQEAGVIPIPQCYADIMVPAERRALGLPAQSYQGYDFQMPAPAWVVYEFQTYTSDRPDTNRIWLEHCAGQTRLIATVRWPTGASVEAGSGDYYGQSSAVVAAIVDRVASDTVYSVAQIAEAAKAAGATVETGTRRYDSCACAVVTGTLQ